MNIRIDILEAIKDNTCLLFENIRVNKISKIKYYEFSTPFTTVTIEKSNNNNYYVYYDDTMEILQGKKNLIEFLILYLLFFIVYCVLVFLYCEF